RRLQLLQRVLDAMQIGDAHRASIAFARRQRSTGLTEPRRDGADAERFADIARERLRDRAVVLHPVELPDVPHVRKAHRCIARLVVAFDEMVAEYGVADAAQRIRAAVSFAYRIQLPKRIVLAGCEQALHARPERFLQTVLAL